MTKEERAAYNKRRYEAHKAEIAEYTKRYRQTQLGRAIRLRSAYIREDRKRGRIGDELPKDYVTPQWIVDNIFNSKCVYSGEDDWRKLGCNRLDNSKPHTIDNVEPCTYEWNLKLEGLNEKQIAQIDKITGDVLAIYPSAYEAHRQTSVNRANIWACCSGKRNCAGGYIWQYIN